MATEYAGAFERDGDLFAVYDDDTEAMIDPLLIREAGWKREDENDPCEQDHCGTEWCSCAPISLEAREVMERWHNTVHQGTYRFCDAPPCSDIRAIE